MRPYADLHEIYIKILDPDRRELARLLHMELRFLLEVELRSVCRKVIALLPFAAIAASLGLFAHAELRMVSLHRDAVADRRSVLIPADGVDPRRACVEQLILSVLEPSPYATMQVAGLEIEPGYFKDTYRFTGRDASGNDYAGKGYVTFARHRRDDGSLLECSQSSATGDWQLRGLRLRLWHEGTAVWEDRDPIG